MLGQEGHQNRSSSTAPTSPLNSPESRRLGSTPPKARLEIPSERVRRDSMSRLVKSPSDDTGSPSRKKCAWVRTAVGSPAHDPLLATRAKRTVKAQWRQDSRRPPDPPLASGPHRFTTTVSADEETSARTTVTALPPPDTVEA